MGIKQHKQATMAPKIRADLLAAPTSVIDGELACQYDVSNWTLRRCRYRGNVPDRTHLRLNLLTRFTHQQDELLSAALEFFRLGLDHQVIVAREFLDSQLSRLGLHRMLNRRGVPMLAELTR